MFAFGGNGQSPAVKIKAWQNVPLTPGRIPSFYVPSSLHLSVSPRFRKPKDTDEYRLLSSSSTETPSPGSQSPSASPRFPLKLRLTPQSNRKRLKEDVPEPSAKASTSLKPMEKASTPYGSRNLTPSPNVSRRESLFHRRRGDEDWQSPGLAHAFPELRDRPVDEEQTPSPEPHCSARTSERKRLRLLLSKTQTAFKSLTPKNKKNHVKKVQDVL